MAIYINGESLKEMQDKVDSHDGSISTMQVISKGQDNLLQGALTESVGIKQGDGKALDSVQNLDGVESVIVSA